MRKLVVVGIIALCASAAIGGVEIERGITPLMFLIMLWGVIPKKEEPMKPVATQEAVEAIRAEKAKAAAGQLSVSSPEGGGLSGTED